jgi:hypothetical protein
LKDNRSPEVVFPEFENVIGHSRFGVRRKALRRLPAGTALRLMIIVSLLIWAGLVGLFVHFFA